jgi:LPPG:FO 2-phospho-L-lactate transferase
LPARVLGVMLSMAGTLGEERPMVKRLSGIVGLGGGIGASRLWRALAGAVDPSRLTVVANTGDDLWIHGLRVCPDIDTTLYALSGRQDPARGWGLRGESFRCMDALRALGHPVWFNLGDLDLATHLLRTGLLRDGIGLVEATRRLADAMGVPVSVLPMTEHEVTTRIETVDGSLLHYEEFLVRHGAAPPVRRVHHDGLDRAQPAPGVLAAIADADVIVLAPSNPTASIAPILGVRGVREALRAAAAAVVAISPIVSGVPIADPGERRRAASRTALLRSAGVPATAAGVAGLYRDVCRRYVLDSADATEADAVRALGLEAVVVPTLVHAGAPAQGLVDAVLAPD